MFTVDKINKLPIRVFGLRQESLISHDLDLEDGFLLGVLIKYYHNSYGDFLIEAGHKYAFVSHDFLEGQLPILGPIEKIRAKIDHYRDLDLIRVLDGEGPGSFYFSPEAKLLGLGSWEDLSQVP